VDLPVLVVAAAGSCADGIDAIASIIGALGPKANSLRRFAPMCRFQPACDNALRGRADDIRPYIRANQAAIP